MNYYGQLVPGQNSQAYNKPKVKCISFGEKFFFPVSISIVITYQSVRELLHPWHGQHARGCARDQSE